MTDTEDLRVGYNHVTDLANRSHVSVSIQSENLPLELRTVIPNDASALLRIYSDEDNVKYDPSAAGLDSLPDVERLITSWAYLTDPLTRLPLVVVAKGEVIGVSGMGHMHTGDDGKRIGSAGVMINPDAHGKGYAYESLRITIDYALRVLKLDEVTVETKEANIEMRELMDKKFGNKLTISEVRLYEYTTESVNCINKYSYRFRKGEWLEDR